MTHIHTHIIIYINKLHIVDIYKADSKYIINHLMRRRLMGHNKKYGLDEYQLYGSHMGKSTCNILVTT